MAQPLSHTGRFVVLDGMRGLAACAVIVDHVPSQFLGPLLPGRYLAVDFFFLLSGFVLSHVYGDRLATGMSPRAFMGARLARFLPLYWLGTLVGVCMSVLYIHKGWADGDWSTLRVALLFNLVFLPSPPWFGGSLFPFDGPAWSLFYELAINLVYAFLAVGLSLRRLATICIVTAAVLAWVVLRLGHGGNGWHWDHVEMGTARVAFSFFAGVLIYRVGRKWTFPTVPAWLALLALAAVFAVPVEGAWRTAFDIAASLVVFPVILMLGARSSTGSRGERIFLTLGALSYGVYVLQAPMKQVVEVAVGTALGMQLERLGDGAVLLVLVVTAVAVAAANALYDAPLRRWLAGQIAR
jgi:peptidoglycan/LPS O-acetylase OafA/YrhL